MPLKKGASDKTRSHNIAEMVSAGHDPRQAAAAAYRQQRESKRKHKAKDAKPMILFDNDTELLLEKGARPTRDGYLKAMARVARVGVQTYRGYELGMPEREHVTLYRPPEEVFARDAMRSMAAKPITLTHPKRMVDKASWGKVAKGFSGNEVVRDGEFVRVPLMLADAAAIDAFVNGEARELSVGYSTDIDWTAGQTPDGLPYDGVQRSIRANHHALVPVARGGEKLRFGDAAEWQGGGLDECPNCGASLTGKPLSCPQCGYDIEPTARSDEEIGDFDPDQPRGDDGKWTPGQSGGDPSKETEEEKDRKTRELEYLRHQSQSKIKPEDYDDNELNERTIATRYGADPTRPGKYAFSEVERPPPKNVKIPKGSPFYRAGDSVPSLLPEGQKKAAHGGASQETETMPIIRTFDGIPISFSDEISAAAMEREMRKLADQLKDAGSDNFGGKKSKPFGNGNGNGDSDADDTEAARKKVTAEDALKQAVAAKDGEIAVLKKQIADAGTVEAKIEALAAERIALLDAAKPFLPKEFKDAGKTLAEIRRAAVGQSLGDSEIKDWNDAQITGAFMALAKSGAGKSGAASMASGMSQGMRDSAGYVGGGRVSLADAEADANKAYGEYCKRLTEGYRQPFTVVRN